MSYHHKIPHFSIIWISKIKTEVDLSNHISNCFPHSPHHKLSLCLNQFNVPSGCFLPIRKTARSYNNFWLLGTHRSWGNWPRFNLPFTFVYTSLPFYFSDFGPVSCPLILILQTRTLWCTVQTISPWLCANLGYCLKDFPDLISILRISLALLVLWCPSLASQKLKLQPMKAQSPFYSPRGIFKQVDESSHPSVNSDLCLFPHSLSLLKPVSLHTSFVQFLLIYLKTYSNHQLRMLPHANLFVAGYFKHTSSMHTLSSAFKAYFAPCLLLPHI